MSVWFFIWIVFSLVMLGFLGWTLYVLMAQKAAWKRFSSRYKLRYTANALMQTPEMDGEIDGHKVSFFSGEHVTEDVRRSRRLTAIEVNLNSKMPFDGALANAGMTNIVKALDFKSELRPEHKGWVDGFVAGADSQRALQAYLTDERLNALTTILKSRKGLVIFIFRNDAMLLRYDTPDPLVDEAALDKILQALLNTAKLLELKDGEAAKLASEAAKSDGAADHVGLGVQEGAVHLELEEDDESPNLEQHQDEKPDTSKA